MNKQEIKHNLEVLLEAVKAQPEDQFNLGYFKKEEPCGTLFCTVGLACTMPEFQAKGFELSGTVISPSLTVYHAELNGEYVAESDAIDFVFGENSYARLFALAGAARFDSEIGYAYSYWKPNMSHKQLAIARLEKQIELYSDAP